MKTLTKMTCPDRIESILQICHGMTVKEIDDAIRAFKQPKAKTCKTFAMIREYIRAKNA